MSISIPILFKYRKHTSVFLKKLSDQYENYPVEGKYNFVENPLHIEYCMNALSLLFLNVINGKYSTSNILIEYSERDSVKFEDISLLLIPKVFQVYERMAIVEAFIQIIFYIVKNLERIFPKSASFTGTWITIKQYSLLKQKILLFIYELDHIRLPCICNIRRKCMIAVLRYFYSQFIKREWENDKFYSDMFTNRCLTLGKIGCFDIQSCIAEFLEKPSLEEYTPEIKSAIQQAKEEKWKKEHWAKPVNLGSLRWRWHFDNLFEECDYESIEEDELELFKLYEWTTLKCFVTAHNAALSKLFPKRNIERS